MRRAIAIYEIKGKAGELLISKWGKLPSRMRAV